MILKKSLWAMALVLMLVSSCQKEQQAPAAAKPQNNQPQPPPPPPSAGDPLSFQDFGNLDPRVYGTYGWADYFDNTVLPRAYDIVYDPVSGTYLVVFGFYYMGIQEYDALGNLIDPFLGSTMEVKNIPCLATGTAEDLFNIYGQSIPQTVYSGGWTPNIFYNSGGTWNVSPGTLKQVSITKQAVQQCYVIKITVNGHTYYRRVTVP